MGIPGIAVVMLMGSSLMGFGVAEKDSLRTTSHAQSAVLHRMANEPAQDFKHTVQKALDHAQKANEAGKNGNHQELVQHSRKALELAKEAQRAGHNERLNEGVYELGEAIEHGQKQETKDAREHVMHAIMKLSQSADLQVPEGAIPPAS